MKTAVVVGGGIAGLLAAKMLSRRGYKVSLVERDPHCGGLLGSVIRSGVAFDYGAHVLSETGVAEIDELLYGDLDPSMWRMFNVLRAGNWFGGQMNRDSPFPDARTLGESDLEKGLDELAAAAVINHEASASNLHEELARSFGATLAERVAGPVVRKQLRMDPVDLDPQTPFVIRRMVCANAERSRELKQDKRFSEAVAFASYNEGVGALNHYYPRSGGIGQWVENFVAGLERDGVEILCEQTLTAVRHEEGIVHGVEFANGCEIGCDLLAWTLPSAMLLRAANIPFQGSPPAACPIGLYHLVFDVPFLDSNYHITCYDESFNIFRVTLYPGLRGSTYDAPYNCTVEVIGQADTDFGVLEPKVLAELVELGIVAPDATAVSVDFHKVPVGFPATTSDFLSANASQSALAKASLRNTLLLGRACCPPFFTPDVLRAVAEKIGEV